MIKIKIKMLKDKDNYKSNKYHINKIKLRKQ